MLFILRRCLREVVPFLKLRALRRVPFAVPNAEILSYKCPVAVRKVASINLLGSV